jgi:glycine cleavage system H protein
MSTIRGCDLPDDLYYLIDKHVWAKPVEDGLVRVGMTAVAAKMSGGSLAAVTVSKRKMGKTVKQGKSVATIESSKYVGPIATPITGTLVQGNEKVIADPNLAIQDPYGAGWIAEIKPDNWDTEQASLATGPEGLAAYQAKMEADNLSCE